ncbi:MAG: DUF4340 domain-containing protein [Myxococcota bacterium]
MNVRTTGALAMVALLLGAYVYFVEIRGSGMGVEAEAASEKILEVEADAILAVEVPLETGGTARLERDPEESDLWHLKTPLEYPADSGTVSGMLSALVELESEALIEDASDLQRFGLGPEAPEVRIELDGGKSLSLSIGNEAPLGSARYVAVEGDDRVFTVAQWRSSALRPTIRKLRDKRVTTREPDRVDFLRISEFGIPIVELRRGEGGEGESGEDSAPWRIVHPIEELADGERVQRLLEDLHFLRAIEFVDDPGEDLSAYGIDRPEITIELGEGDQREVLEVGRGDKVHIRSDRTPVIFEVYDRTLADIPRDLFSFREKRVLTVDEDQIAALEIRFPREDAAYVYLRDDFSWKPETEETPEFDALKAGDIVYAARKVVATGLEEGSVDLKGLGLDPPGVRVTFRDEEGAEIGWLELGDVTLEKGIIARSSQNDRIWWVKEEMGEDVPLSLDAFQNRFLEDTPPDNLPIDDPNPGDP